MLMRRRQLRRARTSPAGCLQKIVRKCWQKVKFIRAPFVEFHSGAAFLTKATTVKWNANWLRFRGARKLHMKRKKLKPVYK